MNGKLKSIIVSVCIVCLIVGYYFYLSNRPVQAPAVQTGHSQKVTRLISKNLDGTYYPELPTAVVDLYSQIVEAYYFTELSDDEIKGLGSQARKLFDDELLERNPEKDFYQNLKADIADYNKVQRKIYAYTVEKANEIDVFTFENKNYARVSAAYVVREDGASATIYEDYMLRKGADGRWKILYWENTPLNIEAHE